MTIKKIDKENVEDILSLSPLQEGLLFHYLTEPDSEQYFEQLVLHLEGEWHEATFRNVLQNVVQANEMLRSIFRWEKLEKPIQIILKQVEPTINLVDLSGYSDTMQSMKVEELIASDRAEKIDISVAPWRVHLYRLSGNKSVLVLSNHHLILDGWSTGLLLKELIEGYNSLLSGRSWQASTKPKYKQFIRYIEADDKHKQQQFWSSYLNGFEVKTPLPTDKKVKSEYTKTKHVNVQVPKLLSDRMQLLVAEEGVTVASVFYTAWGILLQKYGNMDDVLFGTTVSGRNPDILGIEQMVGLFINTIPLRFKTNSDETIAQILKRTSRMLRDRGEFDASPLTEIKAHSEFKSKESLFDSIVVIENYPLDQAFKGLDQRLRVTHVSLLESTHYPLALAITMDEPFNLQFQYKAEMFEEATIQRLADHFVRILTSCVKNPHVRTSQIVMLGENEIEQLCKQYNQTETKYPVHLSIHEMFESQAELHPDTVALICNQQKMTYRELNEKANRLAWFLKARGIGEESIVGVMIERSFEMIIGILGILKAGAAYVPIDPDYPSERITYLLNHSRTSVLLVDAVTERNFTDNNQTSVFSVNDIINDHSLPQHNVHGDYHPDRLIYVLYTSGSTGNPKGVMVKMHAFVNLLHWFTREFCIDDQDVMLLIAPSSFDLAQKNMFCTLIQGGKLCLFEPGLYDYNRMSDLIFRENVSLINCAPSAVYPLIDFNEGTDFLRIASLRLVFLGGEPINLNRLMPWMKSARFHAEIANTYGPTECTDIAAFLRLTPEEAVHAQGVPMGKPIDNTKLYVLDREMNVLPEGRIGELYIGGVGLARGYFHAPELTSERFVDNPFDGGQKLYRTGDLVRYLPDGNLDYIGRTDYQVKIRGMRVELAEIEALLLNHSDVQEVVVIDWQGVNGIKYLCAYIVGATEQALASIKAYAVLHLPDYMVPTAFMRMEQLPLTPNSKIDKKALPEPQFSTGGDRDLACNGSETELQVLAIWQKVLGAEEIGLYDQFFDIGGNSILLIQMHSQLEKILPGKITIIELFSSPTIAQIAQFIEKKDSSTSSLQSLEYVTLPAVFFREMLERQGASVHSHHFEGRIPEEIWDICSVEQIEMQDLMLALFIYLLAEFSEQQTIVVQIHTNQVQFIPFVTKMDSFEHFSALFQHVRNHRLGTFNESIELDHLRLLGRDKAPYDVLPLYSKKKDLKEPAPLNVFDLIWEVDIDEIHLNAVYSCTCNANRFNREQMNDLVDGYSELIGLLAHQYEKSGGKS
ncbi:non-ribosomal peptide synthetase [Paenibacillus glacialis]|uniref:Carrier domain-containing protein n=1 Tax=Paenibacillus glacialis TaxID=494026 RepID=A0A168MJI9_9BACL|nr:non-ribosomal peptide synthetase [Paenibacillus glacialis]OAB44758.1 hypothetical protein PGLA_04915 [Paenibacillus glacialis]